MTICNKCKGTNIKRNKAYLYHDIFECLGCDNWIYEKVSECCRNPFEIIVIDQRSTSSFIRRQCLNCGGCITMTKPLNAKLFDKDIRGHFSLDTFQLWKAERKEEADAIYKSKQTHFRNSRSYKYLEYLASNEWKDKRELVLSRDNNLCQNCKQQPAKDIHHLRYDNLFSEPLEDLKALCRICHAKEHSKKLIG